MGWLFTPSFTDKSQIVRDRTKSYENETVKWTILDWSVRGNNLWKVVEYIKKVETGSSAPIGVPIRFIALDLLQNGNRSGDGWGYKDISEGMGPNEVNCPLKFLKATPPDTSEYAKGWREKVREYHTKTAARASRKLEVGGTYELLRAQAKECTILSLTPMRISLPNSDLRYSITKSRIGERIR